MKSNDSIDQEKLPLRVQDLSQLVEAKSNAAVPSKVAAAPAKILFLDGIRGLAAILVVCQHSGEYLHDLDLGACAVDTLFVLSAFLLTMLFLIKSSRMLNEKASSRKWILYLLDYVSKRFLRVYPLFASVAVLLWILPFKHKQKYYLVKSQDEFELSKVLTFSFPHRYFVFWTLPLEITYYICLPILGVGFLKLGRLWWVPFLPLYAWIFYAGWHDRRSSHSSFLPHLPTFLAGSMAAALYVTFDTWSHATGFKFSKLHQVALRAVEYATVAVIMSVCFRRNSMPGQPAEPTMFFHWAHTEVRNPNGFPFISVPVTLVIVIEMLLPSGISRMFEWSVLRYWGKISFSVYLLHSFVLFSDIYGKGPTLYYDRLFARFGLILVLCTVSYYIVEYPFQLGAQHITRMLSQVGKKGFRTRLSFDAKQSYVCVPRATQSA